MGHATSWGSGSRTPRATKFWLKVFNDLKTRGVGDMLIAVTNGLKGSPETLDAAFPATTLRPCIVHLIRNSREYASCLGLDSSTKKIIQVAVKLRIEFLRTSFLYHRAKEHGSMLKTY